MTVAGNNQAQPPKKNWTVLVWAASDNNLYPYEINDLDKFERVGPSDQMNLVAAVDHAPNPDPTGPTSYQTLEIAKDPLPGLHSPVKSETPSGNMADPKALADFIRWGVKNYPAEHYWLVISDHGDSWQGACEDESHGSWMSLPDLHGALREARQDTGQKLDLVSFDCCYMASAEVAHQLQDETRYLVGSEESMGYLGLDYDTLLPEAQNMAPRQLVERLVEISSKDEEDVQTFSGMDLAAWPAVGEAATRLAQAIVASPKSGDELRALVAGTEAFETYRDAADLADKLSADPALKEPADAFRAALQQAVVAERHNSSTHPNAHGVTVETARGQGVRGYYFEKENQQFYRSREGGYEQTGWAKDTGWDQVVDRFRS